MRSAASRGFAVLQNRAADHQVVGAAADRLPRGGRALVIVGRGAGRPNARAHDQRGRGKGAPAHLDGVARDDDAVASCRQRGPGPANDEVVDTGPLLARRQIGGVEAREERDDQKARLGAMMRVAGPLCRGDRRRGHRLAQRQQGDVQRDADVDHRGDRVRDIARHFQVDEHPRAAIAEHLQQIRQAAGQEQLQPDLEEGDIVQRLDRFDRGRRAGDVERDDQPITGG